MNHINLLIGLLLIGNLLPFVTQAGEQRRFGGPNAVENVIEDDATSSGGLVTKRLLQSWFEQKAALQDAYGLSFGLDYTGVYLRSDTEGVSGEDNASGGIFRFFGAWDLIDLGDSDKGALVWKVEHRHRYGDLAPSAFGFDQGVIGLIEPPFSNEGSRLTNLYWRQRLAEGRITLTGGFLDVTDYVDVFAMGSPWTGFMNFAFSTGSTTAYLPNDATLGFAGGAMLSDEIYIIAGIANAYADPTDPFDGFDRFFDDQEYFTSIELGWTQAQERIYSDNLHLTLWHVDDSQDAGTPGGWGLTAQWIATLENGMTPFIRGGYADDGGSLMQKSLSLGVGVPIFDGRDQIGLAVNWGEPNEDTFGPGLRDQYTAEIFYRFHLTEQLALTADLQYIHDPAFNLSEDALWIGAIRSRLAL
jgi:porin